MVGTQPEADGAESDIVASVKGDVPEQLRAHLSACLEPYGYRLTEDADAVHIRVPVGKTVGECSSVEVR